MGSMTCESSVVAPCPGKCFITPITPPLFRPRAYARLSAEAVLASVEKARDFFGSFLFFFGSQDSNLADPPRGVNHRTTCRLGFIQLRGSPGTIWNSTGNGGSMYRDFEP